MARNSLNERGKEFGVMSQCLFGRLLKLTPNVGKRLLVARFGDKAVYGNYTYYRVLVGIGMSQRCGSLLPGMAWYPMEEEMTLCRRSRLAVIPDINSTSQRMDFGDSLRGERASL